VKSIATLVLITLSSTGSAEEVLARYSWEAAAAGPGMRVVPPSAETAFARLEIVPAAGIPSRVLTIDRPRITSARYALRGQVRHDGVEGEGYLEMWNHFPNGGRFFSRSLAQEGPMQSLRGSSGWRPFVLPFFNDAGAPPPSRLEVNVFLPGRGSVFLGPLELVQFAANDSPLAGTGVSWSTDRQAGLLGAVIGSVLGAFGAITGLLGGRGRAPRFVLGLLKTEVAIGATLLVLGLVALTRSQPSATVFTLILGGVVAVGVAIPAIKLLSRRYQEEELRRMTAMDTR
jgi:hypothetical protein